jgi:hypothetical protein
MNLGFLPNNRDYIMAMFSTVEIVFDVDTNNFKCYFYDLDGDRNGKDSTPDPLGFYHYPRRIGKEKAFTMLRDLMIKRRKNIINTMLKAIESLENLEIPK